jgi:hypothetical protein
MILMSFTKQPVMSGSECIKQLHDWSHFLSHVSPILTLDKFVSSRNGSIISQNGQTIGFGNPSSPPNHSPSPLVSVDNLHISDTETPDDRNAPLFLNKELIMIGISSCASKEELAKAFLNGMHFFCPKPVETVMLASILNIRKNAPSLEGALTEISKQASRTTNASMINTSTKIPFISTEISNATTGNSTGKFSPQASPSDLNMKHTEDYGEVAVTKSNGRFKFFNSLSGIFNTKDT